MRQEIWVTDLDGAGPKMEFGFEPFVRRGEKTGPDMSNLQWLPDATQLAFIWRRALCLVNLRQ